jgi:cytochrome P450
VLVTIDPPEHTPLRKVAQRGFRPRMVAAWEPEIRELVDGLLDGFAGRGHCDFVAEFSDWLPVQAITQVVGAPFEEHLVGTILAAGTSTTASFTAPTCATTSLSAAGPTSAWARHWRGLSYG